MLYVNLNKGPDIDTTKPLRQGEQYPMIESVASDFDTFLASLPSHAYIPDLIMMPPQLQVVGQAMA